MKPAAIGAALAVLSLASAAAAQDARGTWAYAGKTGIGTSYEAYANLAYSSGAPTGHVSKVWFSLAKGVVTETMFGLIHEAQLRQMQFAMLTDAGVETEAADATSRIQYLHTDAPGRPLSLAYRITTRAKSGRWEIEKHVFTDPDGDALFVRAIVRALKGEVTPHLVLDPQLANTSGGDMGAASPRWLRAWDGNTHLFVTASQPFTGSWARPVGQTDFVGWLTRSRTAGEIQGQPAQTPGDIELAGRFAPIAAGQSATYDIVLGFGRSEAAARTQAEAALGRGYAEVLARYNGEGARVGWEDYLANLPELPRLAQAATDGGKLLHASALVLKAQEDKTHSGALIASLSNPWGDTASAAKPQTGYKAVWPRDFYQVASAMLALGDRETPAAALNYLRTVQAGPKTSGNKGAGGWFLQKIHVDGQPEWVGVQLDQTAMPVMLAWKLWKAGVVSDADLRDLYPRMLKPAADFLSGGGMVDIQWNRNRITPPKTQQERWEEQEGYSPSTTAAVVAGLVAGADIARASGDGPSADRYLVAADRIVGGIERTMFTTAGGFRDVGGDGRYFLRITRNEDPNDRGPLESRNGQQPLTEDQYLDAGFLELVRYGVRRADAPSVLASLDELDNTRIGDHLRVKYLFRFDGEAGEFPGWRRYGNDGYGEDAVTGANYGAGAMDGGMGEGQRGRVWPMFTGERGHYELARALAQPGGAQPRDVEALRRTYVRAMELFANEGLMLPEQVWDGVGKENPHGYVRGEGTNSATPLAWTHAEYVKLLRSIADLRVWDQYPVVAERYARPSVAASAR
ncbi:MAG TPA: glucan 1,4-alpha-glucosidase [Caulobacteraceae bacterium]|jgi:glucoamylase